MKPNQTSKDTKSNNSRRDFIKNTVLAATGFYIVPRHVLGRGFIAPSDKLLIAGIGAGGKGGDDIRQFSKNPHAVIAYLCDVDDRQAEENRKLFPKAKYYKDWRELMDKEAKNFDAVSVGTPDHNHAIITHRAMQLKKHVYVQKPLTHDIYEAKVLGDAAQKYKVVTQMGDQGASGDGVRTMMEWYEAGLIGDIEEIDIWTNRPVWPQGIKWPNSSLNIPKELDWDLWLGTAPQKDYIENLVPFNWRGWWDYGTGALGDMGCHLIGPAFKVLQLGFPTEVYCSVSTFYDGIFQQAFYPESGPASSAVHFKYQLKNGKEVKLNWMDGGIQPERPEELSINESMSLPDDKGNGAIFRGTKGKMLYGTYGRGPRLLSKDAIAKAATISQKYKRVPGSDSGHYSQWVEACLAGYEKGHKMVSSPFEEYAVPLTESILMGNLAIRSFNLKTTNAEGKTQFPGRDITLNWDAQNLRVTNFEAANQFVKRTYRNGWGEI
jgi:predicted dehydrogenase